MRWWSLFGRVEVSERIWRSHSKRYLRRLPQALGVTPRGRSRRLERALTDFGCEQSFARAAQSVQEHYGFEIGITAVRTVTLIHASRARQELNQQYQQPFRAVPERGQEHVIAQTDGTMICTVQPGPKKGKRPREWKEMRLVAAQAKGSVSTIYAAGFTSVAETGARWGHCARQAGWGLNSRIHTVGDGAEWIRLQSQEVFGRQGSFLCDFFHVSEYLGAAATTCRPKQPDQWRRTQQKRLRRGATGKVLEALAAHLEGPATPDEHAPVRTGHRKLDPIGLIAWIIPVLWNWDCPLVQE